MFAQTPAPPYTAVIFTNQRRQDDGRDYSAAAERMDALARTQPGFLGVESVRDTEGFGVTISYWQSDAAAHDWKQNAEHQAVQGRGRSDFYAAYVLRVATVHREATFKQMATVGTQTHGQITAPDASRHT